MLLSVNETKFGYILYSSSEKYVFNRSKISNSKVDYYLKQVSPTEIYISGMFYDKQKNIYKGKTKNGTKINLSIDGNLCDLKFIQ